MRERRYRGRHWQTGDWLYGSSKLKGDDPTTFDDVHMPLSAFWDLVGKGILDPKTVGDWIGLSDKNGKEIYESDIVRATANGNRKYQIVWLDGGMGHWWIADIQRDNLVPNKIPINLNAIEVIGNIYENPELVKTNQN